MALCLHGGSAPSVPIRAPLGAPATLRRNIAGLQAGNGLLEALQMLAVARALRGQLSAAMHLEEEDLGLARRLLPILERRTGRIVVNAFAHPQEVSFASVHGGPFPASSDSRFTSVGMTSIERFLRPVCYQGFPDALLPEALRDSNPLGVPRSIDGL